MLPISVKAFNLSDFKIWLSSVIENSIKENIEKETIIEVIEKPVIKEVIVEKIVYVTTTPSLDVQSLLNKISYLENTLSVLRTQKKADTVYIKEKCPILSCPTCPICSTCNIETPIPDNDLTFKKIGIAGASNEYDVWKLTPIGEAFKLSYIDYNYNPRLYSTSTRMTFKHITITPKNNIYKNQKCINCYSFGITEKNSSPINVPYDKDGNAYSPIISTEYTILMPQGTPIINLKATGEKTGIKIGY